MRKNVLINTLVLSMMIFSANVVSASTDSSTVIVETVNDITKELPEELLEQIPDRGVGIWEIDWVFDEGSKQWLYPSELQAAGWINELEVHEDGSVDYFETIPGVEGWAGYHLLSSNTSNGYSMYELFTEDGSVFGSIGYTEINGFPEIDVWRSGEAGSNIIFVFKKREDNGTEASSSDIVVSEQKVYSDAETVKKVQTALNAAGFDCGTPDGKAGNKTYAALNAFQQVMGLTVNNEITDEVLSALGIS